MLPSALLARRGISSDDLVVPAAKRQCLFPQTSQFSPQPSSSSVSTSTSAYSLPAYAEYDSSLLDTSSADSAAFDHQQLDDIKWQNLTFDRVPSLNRETMQLYNDIFSFVDTSKLLGNVNVDDDDTVINDGSNRINNSNDSSLPKFEDDNASSGLDDRSELFFLDGLNPLPEVQSAQTPSYPSTQPYNYSVSSSQIAAAEAAASNGLSPELFSFICPSAAPYSGPSSSNNSNSNSRSNNNIRYTARDNSRSSNDNAQSAGANSGKRWSVGSYASQATGVVNIYESEVPSDAIASIAASVGDDGFQLPGPGEPAGELKEMRYALSHSASPSTTSSSPALSPTALSTGSARSSVSSVDISSPTESYPPTVLQTSTATVNTTKPVANAWAPATAAAVTVATSTKRGSRSSTLGQRQSKHASSFCDFPHDFYAPLATRRQPPPQSDFECENADDVPRKQEVRFSGDLYTPLWVRKKGDAKEGWCDLCPEPRWLILKNSAYWYDKNFAHGICPVTGKRYTRPTKCQRIKGNEEMFEGLCSVCNQWIQITTRRGGGGTSWFRHANRCHNYDRQRLEH